MPKRQGKTLDVEVASAIHDFYLSDDISRVMPGKADFITVKTANGGREKRRKRHLTMTVAEAYQIFKARHPDKKVKKSKFEELRPQNVLLCSKMPHNVCICKYHANMGLLLEALHGVYP